MYADYQGATRNSTALRLRAIPLRLGVQYAHPLGRRISLGLEGGAGLYFTQLFWSHHLDVTHRTTGWISETRGLGLGLHGGVSVDFGLSDRLGLVFDVVVMRANIAGLHGFHESTFGYRSPIRDDGALRLSETPWCAQFLVVGNRSWLNDRYGPITPIREASVGLGGNVLHRRVLNRLGELEARAYGLPQALENDCGTLVSPYKVGCQRAIGLRR